jgi:hypothetical protein
MSGRIEIMSNSLAQTSAQVAWLEKENKAAAAKSALDVAGLKADYRSVGEQQRSLLQELATVADALSA